MDNAKVELSKLFPAVATLAREVMYELNTDGHCLVKAGQRSGKTVLLQAVVDNSDYQLICLYSSIARRDMTDHWSRQPGKFNDMPDPAATRFDPTKVLVLFDEAMWIQNSRRLFLQACSAGFHALAVSSRGPEFEHGWQYVPGHSFSTWDLNPTLSLEELLDLGLDMPMFMHDFCAY